MKKKTSMSFSTLTDQAPTDEVHAPDAGLVSEEYERIKRLLSRAPNKVELGIIGAMWSEHCSYKSSRAHLSKLPSKGPHVLVGPGENAGVIDIGEDLAIVFKIESHNHPSFIEPFQGAATGVGGILRDIFTMGAEPFAAANFLRFGQPTHPKVPKLIHGVVSGIASYGNCFGVPTVASNVDFHRCYDGNNLVNAFAIGVVKKEEIFLGSASGVNNRVLYVGASTGRDGIMGAVMASDVFAENTEHKRPTVQVGDPFTQKLLLNACLEVFKQKLVVGIQDMGAAGLSCSTFEMASRGSTGLTINLDQVPLRDDSMSAYDIMLSESQERMLMVVKPQDLPVVKQIFQKYDLACVDIGFVTSDSTVKIHHRGREVVNLSANLVIENAPRYRRSYLSKIPFDKSRIKDSVTIDVKTALDVFKNDLGQKDLSWITEQFDHHIGLNTVVGPNESDATMIRVPNSTKAVVISLSGNGRLCKINPFEGARRTVFHAALEVSAQGATEVGITNCLNFGSPQNIQVMTELKHVIDGMAHAAIALDTPIISGNVSLYNETDGQPIFPTLALCLVGLTDNPRHSTKFSNARAHDVLVLLGELPDDFTGAESILGDKFTSVDLRPWDEDLVFKLCEIMRTSVHEELLTSACVVGRGGLLHAVVKIMTHAACGATLEFGAEWLNKELALGLLSEDSPGVVVAINEQSLTRLQEHCVRKNISVHRLGRLGGEQLVIAHHGNVIAKESQESLVACYKNSLGDFLANH